ncbi:MAG: hypothetical protein Q4B22_10525, partial [Eubacteriales bacterium]|nr:hypothetical protein [Eubacteriales bacterium]
MKSNYMFFIVLAVSFLPFVLFMVLNNKANVKKESRHQQYLMPLLALVYSIVLIVFMDRLSSFLTEKVLRLTRLLDLVRLGFVGEYIRGLYNSWGIYFTMVVFNSAALLAYIILKRILTLAMGKRRVYRNTLAGTIVSLFYAYDDMDVRWYIKPHYGQARKFVKTAYYGGCILSGAALMISCWLCMKELISAPFYPVFAVIILGEIAFFIDGAEKYEEKSSLTMQADNSRHIVMYPLIRKPLKALFGDKLSADGTTVNNGSIKGGAIEDVLSDLRENGGHVGNNYALFIKRKMENGLKPNVDYVRSGYDLAVGKSLLFNTPFYAKLNPYVFYAMNRELLTGGKVLIVLGRHGTEADLQQWVEEGMKEVSNIPDLWKTAVLSDQVNNEDELPEIGIISRSGVHDLEIHKKNLPFLRKVSFVMVVEPSLLVTTAQIGLNLLIKCCGQERAVTFCSVDRNCDGLVDALSHILMTNITEVSATEYPHGMSSYMYWTADGDYLQHRLIPGASRYLGMGTELSFAALKNQVKRTIWYGGDAFPVLDAHWIAKQYYYDLLDYAQLPTNQEIFDKLYQASFNMCNERVSDYSYVTVEDDRNNLFETRRNFATIAEEQGFVNVISSEYMLREYMAANTDLFTADAKAIPYITADYARTKRNAILSLCLLMCIDSVKEEILNRQMVMLNIDTEDPASEIWKEICVIFGSGSDTDKKGNPILSVKNRSGNQVCFEKEATILFKRAYSVESGTFESVYTIEDTVFAQLILDDLQNASYIAEQDSKDIYIGTELKGHVYQKYLPGQFFTLNGKYYEMIATAADNRILVRRASEHINGRLSYRQIRNYTIHSMENSSSMGALKTINNIDIHFQYADFSVETPGYWRLHAHNDFDHGDLVKVNGVPTREYHHKQILKLDFSRFGDTFTDSVRMTMTNLLNEVFVTLFADNQPFISAITAGSYDAPLTYNLTLADGVDNSEQCIYIVEDSQLDIGLLIAVERNINRIFQIISDYLSWNDEQIFESMNAKDSDSEKAEKVVFDPYEEDPSAPQKKKCFLRRIIDWFKGLFKKKKKTSKAAGIKDAGASENKNEDSNESSDTENAEEMTAGEAPDDGTADGESVDAEDAEAETAEAESGSEEAETAEAESD